MKSASTYIVGEGRRPLQGSNRHYVWWIAAVMLIGGATALSLAGGEKYAPAEQGTVTLSRSF